MSADLSDADAAAWLVRIANDVRAAGDVQLVRLSEDGVTPEAITLADELWLVAFMLDADTASIVKEEGTP